MVLFYILLPYQSMKDLYPIEKPIELPADHTVAVGVICPLMK